MQSQAGFVAVIGALSEVPGSDAALLIAQPFVGDLGHAERAAMARRW